MHDLSKRVSDWLLFTLQQIWSGKSMHGWNEPHFARPQTEESLKIISSVAWVNLTCGSILVNKMRRSPHDHSSLKKKGNWELICNGKISFGKSQYLTSFRRRWAISKFRGAISKSLSEISKSLSEIAQRNSAKLSKLSDDDDDDDDVASAIVVHWRPLFCRFSFRSAFLFFNKFSFARQF